MKTLLVLLICISISSRAHAQQSKEDLCKLWRYQMDTTNNLVFAMERSKELYQKVDDECQAKIDILIGEVHMLNHRPDSAHIYTSRGLLKAKEIGSTDALILGLNKQAALYIEEEKFEEAKATLTQAKELLIKDKSSRRWLGYFDAMANIADIEGNYLTAISYLDSTISLGYMEDSITLATTYHNKGVYFLRLSDFESSAENFIKAYTINSKTKGGDIAANCMMLGNCYNSWNRYEPARKYLEEGIVFAKNNSNYDHLIKLYSILATNLRLSGKEEEALATIDKVLEILETRTDHFESAKAKLEKARILLVLDPESKQAFTYTQEAYEQSKRSVALSQIAPTLEMAKFKIKEKEYNVAKRYLDEAKQLSEILKRANYVADYNLVLSKYYEGTKEYKLALQTRGIYQRLTDSIANKEVMVQVAALEERFNSQQKELDILRLNEENAVQSVKMTKAKASRNFYLSMSLLLAGLMLGGLFVYQKLRSQKKSLDHALKRAEELDHVKNRLFSVISHDIRSMIFPFRRASKVLKHHINKGNKEKTLLLASDLEKNANNISVVLDNLLEWSLNQMEGYKIRKEELSLKEEFESIFNVFDQHAIEKKVSLKIDADFHSNVLFDKGAFHVIFRNLIANAIKFTEQGDVIVNWNVENDHLVFNIKDTGTGMDSTTVGQLFNKGENVSTLGTQGEKGTGLGLNLVQQFVTKLKGQIQVQSKKDEGTLFSIKFPYQLANA